MNPRSGEERRPGSVGSATSGVGRSWRRRTLHPTPEPDEAKRCKWSPTEAGAATTQELTSGPFPSPTIIWEMKQPGDKVSVFGFHEFKLHYSENKDLAVGDMVCSQDVSAGGHLWTIICYPRGDLAEDRGEYVSIYLELTTYSRALKAMFQVFPLGRDGEPSFSHEKKSVDVFSTEDACAWGWSRFLKRSLLESTYLSDGCVTFLCSIIVLDADNIPVPPSSMRRDLVRLLDSPVGADAEFLVEDEIIHAHRAILAARSPVFKAELFGSTEDGTSLISVQDIEPATFKAMLAFMYTDELPENVEFGDHVIELMQDLLAAADRYALDRLKLVCARKLWDHISEDTFASILICAETYNCPELKSKCFQFFEEDDNLKKIVFTDGFLWLVGKYQSLAAELKERVGM